MQLALRFSALLVMCSCMRSGFELPTGGDVADAITDGAGDPAGGDSADGDPVGGDPTGGDAGGDPASGDPAGVGDPAGGDPTSGDPAGGDPAGDALSNGDGVHLPPPGELIVAAGSNTTTDEHADAYGVTVRRDGRIVICGFFTNAITIGTVPLTGVDRSAFLAAYTLAGAVDWARPISNGRVECSGLAALPDNRVAMVGSNFAGAVLGPGDANEHAFVGNREFVAIFEIDGSLSWVRELNMNTERVAVGTGGSVAVAGTMTDALVLGAGEPNETSFAAALAQDTVLAVFEPTGMLGWAERGRGTTGRSSGHTVTPMFDGGYAIAGAMRDECVFGDGQPSPVTLDSPTGEWGMYVARYAQDGGLRWGRLATGSNDSELTNNSALVALANNDLVYAGPFSDDTVVAPGGADAIALDGGGFPQNELLARFDGSGGLLWAEQSMGSTASNNTHDLVRLSDDSIVLLGWTNTVPVTVAVGQTGETTYDSGGDTVLAKFDAGGQLVWSKLEGGSNSTMGEAAAVGPFDTIVVVGGFTEPATTFGSGETNETTLTTGENSFFVFVESP